MQDRINSQKKHGNRYELLLKSESFHRNYVRFGLGFFIYNRSFFVIVGIYQQYVMLGCFECFECFHRHCHQMGHPICLKITKIHLYGSTESFAGRFSNRYSSSISRRLCFLSMQMSNNANSLWRFFFFLHQTVSA